MKKEGKVRRLVGHYLTHAGDFNGISTRGEYWGIVGLNLLVVVVLSALTVFTGAITGWRWSAQVLYGPLLVGLVLVIMLAVYQGLPALTLVIRRYRGAHVSPWLLIVTHVLAPVLAVWFAVAQWWWGLIIPVLLGLGDLVIKLMPTRGKARREWADPRQLPSAPMTFWPAIKDAFYRGGVFTGRSSRSQFWWPTLGELILIALYYVFLFVGVIYFVVCFAAHAEGHLANAFDLPMLAGLGVALVLVLFVESLIALPQLAMMVRRYRDAGISPWWVLGFTASIVIVSVMAQSVDQSHIAASLALLVLGEAVGIVELVLAAQPSSFK